MSKLIATIVFVLVVVGGYYWYQGQLPFDLARVPVGELVAPKKAQIVIANRGTFTVDVVDTDPTRTHGLSGRATLGPDEGMLFVFDTPDRHGIWMKEMRFSLDIIWFDQDGKVIWIQEDVTPDTYPRTFTPPSPDKYVLEVKAGIAAARGIAIGDHFGFIGEQR